MISILVISVILVFIDQIIKYVVDLYMTLNSSINIINGFFRLTYVRNEGAAFSLFENKQLFLIIITIVALFLMFYFLKNKTFKKHETIIYSMILSGVLANLVDRIFRGYVIDFIDIKIFNYNFPIFNIADICIVLGTIFLIIKILKEKWYYDNKSRYKRCGYKIR